MCGRRQLVEETRSLHVQEVVRLSGLGEKRGWPGMIQWFSREGDVVVEFRFTVDLHPWNMATVRLSYFAPGTEGEFTETLFLEATRTGFRGRRWWFICNGCGRRATRLYFRGQQFGCRQCHRLSYESQRLSPLLRAAERLGKLERKLLRTRRKGKRFKLFLERSKALVSWGDLLPDPGGKRKGSLYSPNRIISSTDYPLP